MKTLVIAKDGSGDFPSLTAAVAACTASPEEPVRFYLRKGVKEERPFLELEEYLIEGESREETILTAAVGGRDP